MEGMAASPMGGDGTEGVAVSPVGGYGMEAMATSPMSILPQHAWLQTQAIFFPMGFPSATSEG